MKMNFKIPASGLFRQLDFMGRSWRDMLARTTTPTFICQLRKGGCPRVHNLQLQFVCKTWSKRNPACPYITSKVFVSVCTYPYVITSSSSSQLGRIREKAQLRAVDGVKSCAFRPSGKALSTVFRFDLLRSG